MGSTRIWNSAMIRPLTLLMTSLSLSGCMTACEKTTISGQERNLAIVYSLGQGCVRCAEEYIENGADVNAANKFGVTPLMEAAGPFLAVGEPEALRRGYDVRTYEYAAIVERLIAEGADVLAEDTNGVTALYRAARNNRVGTAYILLANGARFSANDKSLPLEVLVAARECYPNMTSLLAHAASRKFSADVIHSAINNDPDVCEEVKVAITRPSL